MKIKDLCKLINEYVYIYDKPDNCIYSGYLYDDVPEDVLDKIVGEICVYHEPERYYPELYPCEIGIEIYIKEE